jgi:hypothetical protein
MKTQYKNLISGQSVRAVRKGKADIKNDFHDVFLLLCLLATQV